MTLHGDDRTARPPGAGKALNGMSPGAAPGALPVLEAVCRSATELARSMPTMPRRIRLRHGQTAVEIEWPEPTAPPPAQTPAPAFVAAAPAPTTAPAAAAAPAAAPAAASAEGAPEAQGAHEAQDCTSLHYVCAPTVGTFYHAPEPGERPCVSVGELVRPGQAVGVLEVMKMMSVVEADAAGRVVEVVVPDGQPVEFQQPLIALEPVPVGE
ncbi:acetyl-CoA carboxylase biotin carboxyl carrier protein [Actinacidiphila sp. bgisy160]|uniref:acetyl-CoA carboxylase biotin carboxyl carrier protein n=1 Tax=Actinacidiphila sp. bgisy160 TaxID=3413796 RepID=UPI003D7395D6